MHRLAALLARRTAAGVIALVLVAATLVTLPPSATAQVPGLNGRIAFVRDDRILTIAPDGTDRQVFAPPGSDGAYDFYPAWSPDGTRLAFNRYADEDTRAQIFVAAADGSGLRAITDSNVDSFFPAWSPDGSRIAFSHLDQLITVASDGTGDQTLVATGDLDATTPSWSPDGQTLLYTSSNAEGRRDIFAVPATGGTPTNLTLSAGDARREVNEWPDWSPDGTTIAFVSDAGCDPYCQPHLSLMAADGSGAHRLVDTDPAYDGHPSWSPDGTRLVFSGWRLEGTRLFTVNADGTGLAQLTSDEDGSAVAPSWQPLPAPSRVTVSVGDSSVVEGDHGRALLRFPVTLDRPAAKAVRVTYATVDGTATAGRDYQARARTLRMPAGTTSAWITVGVRGDHKAEPDETLSLVLRRVTGPAVVLDDTAVGTILNDDGPGTATSHSAAQAGG